LAIFRDDVDHGPQIVCKLGNLLGANVPTHTVALGLQLGGVDYGAARLHFEGCGECLTAVFIYHGTRLGRVVNDVFMTQHGWCCCKHDCCLWSSPSGRGGPTRRGHGGGSYRIDLARQRRVGVGEREVLLTKSSHFTLQPCDQSGEVAQLLGNVDRNFLSHVVGWNVLLVSSSSRVDNG
jgi:hypothetical protein